MEAKGSRVKGCHSGFGFPAPFGPRDRWKPRVGNPEPASLLAGSVLTHSDWTPDNVLALSGCAWLIDRTGPTLGAAWTDPACWILRLMASGGHTTPEAERQASRLPAFQSADPRAHRAVRRTQRAALERDRAVAHQRLDGQGGTSRAPTPDLPAQTESLAVSH